MSSPNDLTRLTIDGDEFVQEVVPIDSYLNYTKLFISTGASNKYDLRGEQTITADLLECVVGFTDHTHQGT